MKVILCAAGISKRMGKSTKTIPKPLLPLGQESIIENLIAAVAVEPVKEIIIIIGYLGDQIKKRIGNNFKGIKISYVTNNLYDKTNNMYSILLAKDKINNEMIFISADVYLTPKTCKEFLQSNEENLILIDDNPEYFSSDDPVKVTISNGTISAIDKKLLREQTQGVAIGAYKLSASTSQKFFKIAKGFIEKGRLNDGYAEPIKLLIKENKIKPFYIKEEPWCDVDTPDEYKQTKLIHSKKFREIERK